MAFGTGYGYGCSYNYAPVKQSYGNPFVLIVVLFILLIIVGAAIC